MLLEEEDWHLLFNVNRSDVPIYWIRRYQWCSL